MSASESELVSFPFLLRLVARFQFEVEGVVKNELREWPVRPHSLALDLRLLYEVVLTLVDEGTIQEATSLYLVKQEYRTPGWHVSPLLAWPPRLFSLGREMDCSPLPSCQVDA
jgi:hypothetical protein